MCRAGDIRGFQDAFESGSVSLNVVNPFRMTLLHVIPLPGTYTHGLIPDSTWGVAFEKISVLGFSIWACVLIVQNVIEIIEIHSRQDVSR